MSTKKFTPFVLFFGGILAITILDQLLKHNFRHYGEFCVCNKGISFGIPVPRVIFWNILLFFIFIIIVYVYLYKKSFISAIFLLSIVLIGGGALSNSLDRFLFNCVWDYIILPIKQFPVFNLADVGIFFGTCLLLHSLLSKNSQ